MRVYADDKTGAVTMYANGGPGDGWLWINEGVIASGLGEGAGVRFADINGVFCEVSAEKWAKL